MTHIDLRSDTVTLPSAEMRAAMAAAEVGDDVYGEDPSVRALEERAAELLGKAAGLFVPSGTMGNLLATMTHTRPGDEVICGRLAHTYVAEAGGPARLAGVSTWALPQDGASLSAADVLDGIHPLDDAHYPHTALVWVEQPSGGWTMPLDNLADVAEVAHSHDLPVHMDGARIFNAALALDSPVLEVARPVDSVMFCISKGLGAPVGSLLVGSEAFIASARRGRKVVGGGMRQAGVLAAAGLYALDNMVDRLADDHANAQLLADGLRDRGWSIDREQVETNIFFVEPPRTVSMAGLDARLERLGVLVSTPHTGRTIRLATHYGIEAADVTRALGAFAQLN